MRIVRQATCCADTYNGSRTLPFLCGVIHVSHTSEYGIDVSERVLRYQKMSLLACTIVRIQPCLPPRIDKFSIVRRSLALTAPAPSYSTASTASTAQRRRVVSQHTSRIYPGSTAHDNPHIRPFGPIITLPLPPARPCNRPALVRDRCVGLERGRMSGLLWLLVSLAEIAGG
jgi:hypothetical protein